MPRAINERCGNSDQALKHYEVDNERARQPKPCRVGRPALEMHGNRVPIHIIAKHVAFSFLQEVFKASHPRDVVFLINIRKFML